MNIKNSIKDLGERAKKAAGLLASISNDQKNKALNNLKKNLELHTDELIVTNKKDIDNALSISFLLVTINSSVWSSKFFLRLLRALFF